MGAKHCFDAKCLDLAIYFYPAASADRLNDLAQRIQNEVESEDLDAAAQETPVDEVTIDEDTGLADHPDPETVPAPEASLVETMRRSPRRVQETSPDDGRCICLAGVSDIPEHDEDCPRRQAKVPICTCGSLAGKYCPIHPGDQ